METNTILEAALDRLIPILSIGTISFLLAMLFTPVYTYFAYRYKFWKKPRTKATTGERAVEFHKLHAEKHKRHIPTMAGVIFLVVVAIVTFGLNLSREQTYLPMAAFLGSGLVGLIDDIINIRGLNAGIAGLRSSLKLLLMMLVALLGGLYFYFKLDYHDLVVPFFAEPWQLGVLIVPLFAFVVLATANAVNITDGLDGLSGGLLSTAFAAFATIAFLQNRFGIAAFCMTIVGVLLAYTWFNVFPARFFMGDVGSFALGATLGVVAMLTNAVFILPIIGFVFVAEGGSSLIQILSKKLRGKKVFRVAPIHHHFEAIGWPETKVTMRFWIVGNVAAIVGIIIAATGGLV